MPLLPEEFLISSSRRGSNPLPDRFVIKARANPFHVFPLVAIGAAEGVGFEGIGKPVVRAVQRAAARANFGAAGGAGAHTFRRNNFSPVASLIEGLAAGIGVGITATPVQRLFERYSATHRRMNSDEDMRALERAAAQGDVLARERLARMQQRTSVDVFRLDVGIRDYIRPADYAKFDATPSNYQVVAERYDGGRGIRVTGPRFGPRNGRLLNASEYYGVMYDGVYKSFGSRNSVASRMARSIERLLRGERPRGSYVTKASSHRSVTLVSRVDNLGWLLRAAGKRVIASIRVETSHQGADAHLNVFFRDGTIYESDFDNRGVLWGFLDRPVFRGVPIHWFGVPMGEVTKSRRYWTGTPDGIITRRHNSDEDMRALERAAQLGDPAAIQRLAAMRARTTPGSSPIPRTAPSPRETFAQARARVLRDMGAAGWRLSDPGLKVPHATSPDGRVRLWFKPHAIYVSTGSNFKEARSLGGGFGDDIRALDAGKIVRWAADYAERMRGPNPRRNPATLADAAEGWARRRGIHVPARGSAAWKGLFAAWQRSGMSNPHARRRNSDEDLRALERAAAQGDPAARIRLEAARARIPFDVESITDWARVARDAQSRGMHLFILNSKGEVLGRVWNVEVHAPTGRSWATMAKSPMDFTGRLGIRDGVMGEMYVPLYPGNRAHSLLTRQGARPEIALMGHSLPDYAWRPGWNQEYARRRAALPPGAQSVDTSGMEIPKYPLVVSSQSHRAFRDIAIGTHFRFASQEPGRVGALGMGPFVVWKKISPRRYCEVGNEKNINGCTAGAQVVVGPQINPRGNPRGQRKPRVVNITCPTPKDYRDFIQLASQYPQSFGHARPEGGWVLPANTARFDELLRNVGGRIEPWKPEWDKKPNPRRANMPGAFIFAIGNGSGPRGPVRPVAQHRAARRPNEGGGYRIKLPADRVLGTMPLAEARRRWPNIGIDVQVAAFEDFNRGAKAHPTVILEDDGRREVGADWLGARVPEIVYGGVDGHAPGSFKNSGGVVGGDESESTTWVHQSPNQYLIGHAEVDRDGRPVTRDFRLIGDTVAKSGWLRR